MSKKLKFSIIICNYNGKKYLTDCLKSVFNSRFDSFEVIIIEDGSTDGSQLLIKKIQKKHKLTLILNEINIGLVKSRNKAISLAKGEILVFLDNDTEVDKDWLVGIEQTFKIYKNIGAVQPKMFDFKNRDIIQQVGMKLVPDTGFGVTLGRGEKDNGQYDFPLEIISLGAALAVRKTVAIKIGGFDERLFHYTDDLDFSWRIWIAGYKIVLAYDSKIYHYLKIHPHSHMFYYHLVKNSFRMLIKNYQSSNVIFYLPLCFILNLIGGIYVLFSRRDTKGIVGFIIGLLWTIKNLQDTLSQRHKTQHLRRKSDQDIYNKIMFSGSPWEIFTKHLKNSKITSSLLEKS